MNGRSGSERREEDVRGFWTGVYWYGGNANPTPFNAWLDEAGGELSGTTLEPNTFADNSLPELSATLVGMRSGSLVSFTKLMDPARGVHNWPIRYSGTADAGFQTIEGQWRFDPPHAPTGGFRMTRLTRLSAQVSRRTAAPVE